jgi:acetyl-CoA carboxylase biotin carboxyl carrier protein
MPTLTIKSDITGTVWLIEAQEGSDVEEDQSIMILESMKMEIPVVAPDAGVIKSILVKQGDAVHEGQDLVILELN